MYLVDGAKRSLSNGNKEVKIGHLKICRHLTGLLKGFLVAVTSSDWRC